MLRELRSLLQACSPSATIEDYQQAAIEFNVLGKSTENNRRRSYRYLRELYLIDPTNILFRALRDLWDQDIMAQPLLAMLCALTQDQALRATANKVLLTPEGDRITSHDLAIAVKERYSNSYSDPIAAKIGRNAASSWTQSGHLDGRSNKIRVHPETRPIAVAYALLLGYLEGKRGDMLFDTLWAQVLDRSRNILYEQAEAAHKRGWMEFRRGGGIVDVSFRMLMRPFKAVAQ